MPQSCDTAKVEERDSTGKEELRKRAENGASTRCFLLPCLSYHTIFESSLNPMLRILFSIPES